MTIKIALAGNPNSGKTTLFNALTGSNQFVGNWPGVTVEKKEGRLRTNKEIIITDLPGIYSLSPYTLEEVVARNYLLDECPNAILNIVDGTNIERNLYLTTQLLELAIPVVVAINMMDVVNKKGDVIDTDILSAAMGCTVVTLSALKGTGITEAAEKAVKLAKAHAHAAPAHTFNPEVESALSRLDQFLGSDISPEQRRFYAIKLFERDEKLAAHIPEEAESIIRTVEANMDDDAESIITNERYLYISDVIKSCYKRASEGKLTTSDKIDRIVTNRWLALPVFAAVMFLIYYVSVTTVGAWATDWANDGVFGDGWNFFGLWVPGIPTLLESLLKTLGTAAWLNSLILDGIVAGVGAVLGFVPQMLILFLMLAILEACGYMARIAFIMDRVFHKFGLSGKSFIPILIGTGCGVPAIMSSRTIESEQDRRMTIITATFIPCGAKLPLIALIAGALFGGAWWVAPSAYFVGIIAIISSGVILKKTRAFKGVPAPFVMELPPYHMPTPVNALRSMWERSWSFIKKAGTVILLSAVILWFLMRFGIVDGKFTMVENLNNGFLSTIGGAIAWIFAPLGWGHWQAAVASITGLIAKENVVGTFGVLYGFADDASGADLWRTLASNFSALAAYSFLIFNLLCAPCVAAMGAIRREMNSGKWTFFALAYQTLFAYGAALCIYQLGMLFTTGRWTIGTAVGLLLAGGYLYLLFRPGYQMHHHHHNKKHEHHKHHH